MQVKSKTKAEEHRRQQSESEGKGLMLSLLSPCKKCHHRLEATMLRLIHETANLEHIDRTVIPSKVPIVLLQ